MKAEDYKNLLGSFCTADFGEYTAETFVKGNPYRKPTAYPIDSHPRMLFTQNTLKKVRENIRSEESASAYERYIKLSECEWDGKFETLEGDRRDNYKADKAAIIEAKAFRYAMTGEVRFGYEALYAAKNAMLTLDVTYNVPDACRRHGHLMYVIACVYDWCYDLMSDEDKRQMVAGGVNLLGVHFEVCRFLALGNKLPLEQGAIYGHGAEDQILVDYLAFAIAVYNEAPEIYELVGGRVLNDYVKVQDFMMQGGSHWEGSMYGSVRSVAAIVSNILVNKMTDGAFTLFTPKLEDVIITTTHYIRPDGQVFRIGDINENRTTYQFVWMANNCFYAGNFYKNPYLKSMGYKYLESFTAFTNMVAGLSVVQFLALNDPDVPHIYDGEVPLTRTTSYPGTNIFAKSANNDKDAFGIYMTMPETCSLSHSHAECGSFQIYYKGALATDSGAYDSWGGAHHMGYNMQTISSNSLLIYNPNFANYESPVRKTLIYSGGQSIDNTVHLPGTYEGLMKHPAFGQCISLGVSNVEENGKYLYSYMAGDMTKAYDKETASEVCRYMISIATADKTHPFAFMVFDRITSLDASFRKSALIHVQQAPKLTGDGYAVIRATKRGGSGKMVVQSVGFDTEYTVIGGEGKEFWLPGVDENGNYSLEHGKNLPQRFIIKEGSLEEYGWGRIEISPKYPEKTNRMLTVMYVTDIDNESSPVKAEDISSESLAGAQIFGSAVLFPKNEKLLSKEASFTLTDGADCYITGLCAGDWTLASEGSTVLKENVTDGKNIIVFHADSAGTYTLKPQKK